MINSVGKSKRTNLKTKFKRVTQLIKHFLFLELFYKYFAYIFFKNPII